MLYINIIIKCQVDRKGLKYTVNPIKESKDYSYRDSIKDWVFDCIRDKEIPDVDVPVDKDQVKMLRPRSKETKVHF